MKELPFQITLRIVFNSFSTNVPLLYPLKISENRRFSDAFRGYRKGTLVKNGLKIRKIRVDQRCT